MADQLAFAPPDSQSVYAFPADQGQPDQVDQANQEERQIQQSFDQNRFQRSLIQGVAKTIANQAAQIERLRQQQKSS